MKIQSLLLIVMFAGLSAACQPSTPDFSGRWIASRGILTLTQIGNSVTGSMEGYGGTRNLTLSGTVSGAILTFDGAPPLGASAIILSEDGRTFRSADATAAFCGIREGTTLPDGCGFSGTWKIKTDLAPAGSTAKLTQRGSRVTGSVYGPNGKVLVPLDSTVSWGKGTWADGTNVWGAFTLFITGDEKAFLISILNYPDKEGTQWCGLREGETTAYVLSFDCVIP